MRKESRLAVAIPTMQARKMTHGPESGHIGVTRPFCRSMQGPLTMPHQPGWQWQKPLRHLPLPEQRFRQAELSSSWEVGYGENFAFCVKLCWSTSASQVVYAP